MACVFRGQGSSIARALLPALLFVVFASPTTLAQLYEQPVLTIDPGMHTAAIKDVGVDAAGRIAVTGGLDKTLRVWSLADGELLRTIRIPARPGPIGRTPAVAVQPDGALVAASGRNDSIYVFETQTGKMAAPITGLPAPTFGLAFSLDGHYLAAGFGRNGLRVYDRNQQWSEVFRDTDYGDQIYGVAFSADGQLATTSYDGNVRLYDHAFRLVVPPRKVTAGSEPFRIAFSPDGAVLAVGYSDAPTVDLLDGHSLAPLPGADVSGLNNRALGIVTWSKDGGTLYAGGQYWDGSGFPVLAWADAGRGARRVLQAAHNSPVFGRLAYPMRGEATNRVLLGRKSPGCPAGVFAAVGTIWGASKSRVWLHCRMVGSSWPLKTRSWSCSSPMADLAGRTLRPRPSFEVNKTDWRCRQTAPLSILASNFGASRHFALIYVRAS
jgi:WD40 repeat protein